MTQPIVLSSSQIRTFGERVTPLTKKKAYVFSLDMTFACEAWLPSDGREVKTPVDAGAELRIDGGARRLVAQGRNEKPKLEDEGDTKPSSPEEREAEFRFAGGSGLYHFQDEVLVKSADDAVRNIPHGAPIVRATVFATASPVGGADLCARVLARWQEQAFLSFEMTGVLLPCGALLRLWSPVAGYTGSDRIPSTVSFRTETNSSTFTWLVRNQLFGWGSLQTSPGVKGRRMARFTYDLYSLGG
jgi:hypothetical protein